MLSRNNFNRFRVVGCPPGTNPYIIQAGDTFWSLSQKFGIPLESIINANPGLNPTTLQIGMQVCIPVAPTPPFPTCPPGSVPYTIQPGDTFYLISKKLGVPLETIISLNPAVDPTRLFVGQIICVPSMPVPPPITELLCAIPLLPTDPQISAGGSVWVRNEETPDNAFAFMYAGTFLPEPDTLGDFDAYIGRVSIAQPAPNPPILRSVLLCRAKHPDQQVTWAGTRIITDTPAKTDVLEIRPFNTKQDITGNAILRNTLENCIR